MDPRIAVYIMFFLLVIPRFFTIAMAQVQEIEGLLSEIGSPHRNINLGFSPLHLAGSDLAINEKCRKPDIPDSSFKDPFFTSNGIPVYNPSMLIMIQGLLSRQEVILEYFPSDTMIFTIAITREFTSIFTLKINSAFWKDITVFKRKIRLADTRNCKNQSEALSEILLGTVSSSLKGKTKAIIIPHTALYGFPFEALVYPVSRMGQTVNNSKYLIEGKEIVYNNSIAQWLSSRIRGKICNMSTAENNLVFAGFSSDFEFHECIQELRETDHEISTIGRMFSEKGKTPVVLFNENSNEYNFKAIAGFCQIIHIATHTIINEDFPEMNGLLFHEYGSDQITDQDDGLLAIHEICELQIPADLIVLNACASANIRSPIGLDWYSCADCFMKAGARNVLCTLWNVSDRLADRFMVDFYRYYLAGMSYSKALQQVKIEMISEPSTSLPVNWAAYVLMGQ